MSTRSLAGRPIRSKAKSKIAGSGLARPISPEITISAKQSRIDDAANRGTWTSANPLVISSMPTLPVKRPHEVLGAIEQRGLGAEDLEVVAAELRRVRRQPDGVEEPIEPLGLERLLADRAELEVAPDRGVDLAVERTDLGRIRQPARLERPFERRRLGGIVVEEGAVGVEEDPVVRQRPPPPPPGRAPPPRGAEPAW